jgi:hypothetical protein
MEIINDIRFSKIESGKLELNIEIDLVGLASQVIALFIRLN